MTKFNFKKFRNPQQETFIAKPDDSREPITFTLSPVNTDVSFMANRLSKAIGTPESEELQFQLGFQRVIGWEGIVDENDEEVKFTNKNFAMFLSMPESIDYIMLVGKHTYEQVFPDTKEVMATVEGKVIPAQSDSNT